MRLEAETVTAPSLGLVKMEERKRPAMGDHDDGVAPPLKRQATAVNGTKSHPDADMPWKEDLEAYQKDAIMRQMREYKREKLALETRVKDLETRSLYHDDHLRIVDAWFSQVIDEVKVLAGDISNLSSELCQDSCSFPSNLFFADNEKFQAHLQSRSESIKSAISELFRILPNSSPEVKDLQAKLSKVLAAEKGHIAELQRVTTEKEQLAERLDNASYRYLVAEKKLDRVRSAAVAKLERQALQGSGAGGEDTATAKAEVTEVNGSADGASSSDHEAARKEAEAAAEKRAEQLRQLEGENAKLTEEVTVLNTRLLNISDDDYAKSELFKVLKSQHEDVIKRINDLEATNVQLREEAQRLQTERAAYRTQMDDESRVIISEVESQLAKAETDLTRIRNSRDELIADLAIKRATLDQQRLSVEQTRELANARESRIAALEHEVERLRLQAAEVQASRESQPHLDGMTEDELRAKIASLEKECKLLSNELPSMETAWKKAQALASKKTAEISKWEEQLARLTAEKSKADQKYFAAMKAKEAREAEIRTLRAQNAKSSEIISQLKEAEGSSMALVMNLEKQVVETKEIIANLTNQQRSLQQRITELTFTSEALTTQNNELKKMLAAKDASCLAAAHAQRQAEVEVEGLKARLEETKKSLEGWKKKGLGNQTDEYEMLRTMALCTVCRKNFKNTVIKSCGHIFCQDCVEERITSRSRKCPNCGKSFGASDHMRVTL